MRIAIYKPAEKMSSGVAFQFKIGNKRNSSVPVMFIEAVRQSKPKPPAGSTESPFNWKDDKVTMMLNPDELGSVGAYISGLDLSKALKFTHKSQYNGVEKTSIFQLAAPETEEQKKYGNWMLSVSVKQGTEAIKSVTGYIGPASIYRIRNLADYILDTFNDLEESRDEPV